MLSCFLNVFIPIRTNIENMELLDVELPKKVVIGSKALERIGNLCKELDLKGPAYVFTGPNAIRVMAQRVLDIIESYDYKADIKILPEKINMNQLVGLNDPNFVIGVGGGKVIDVAKLFAKNNKIPFISMPTAISHDGIASDRAVIDTYSIPAVIPTGIVIDTDIIINSPYRLTASGCGDVIAKITAVADWELSHEKTGEYFSEFAANINKTSADLIISSATSIKNLEMRGIRNLIEALVFSGISMSIAGSSRPASGSEHLFSHALQVLYPEKTSLHGEECALGAILCSYLHGMDWQRIKKTLEIIGLPTNSQELDIPDKMIIKALLEAKNIRKDRFTILNYKDVGEKEAEKAAKETGVIE